ncbi:hypothetical protein CLAVI_000282 [Candidatus Clavichlamydia salmonicola]|uniref:DUF5398 family protein n=1 Tax=Candidatus Clavichlamydia salmonicola TaxID=469812 RepID=UPI001891E38A|nr:DUF5398 family protein [Candidatus Clavichlamydia salmonicola]MBF5050667.1 hypothetical protein [Candidatus Clavichlamydia salmonicola]
MLQIKNNQKKDEDSWAHGPWFDIEKEVSDPEIYMQLKEKIKTRIVILEELMRKGDEKTAFEKNQVLMNGYKSLLRVLGRIQGDFI